MRELRLYNEFWDDYDIVLGDWELSPTKVTKEKVVATQKLHRNRHLEGYEVVGRPDNEDELSNYPFATAMGNGIWKVWY